MTARTMYVVDYGEVFTDFTLPAPFYTVAKSGVIWAITEAVGAEPRGRAPARTRPRGRLACFPL